MELTRAGTEENCDMQSKKVMKETVKKTVTTLMTKCFYFLRKSFKQYSTDVEMRALIDKPEMFSALTFLCGRPAVYGD